MNFAASLLSIFNLAKPAAPSRAYFNKSQLFVSPDASQLPAPENWFKPVVLTPEEKISIPHDALALSSSSGEHVFQKIGDARHAQAGATDFPGQERCFPSLSPTSPAIPAFHNTLATIKRTASPRESCTLSSIDILPTRDSDASSHQSCSDYSDVDEDIASLRLIGERLPYVPRPESQLTKLASTRMKAMASWSSGYIFGVITAHKGFMLYVLSPISDCIY